MGAFTHFLHVAHAAIRATVNRSTRSPKWRHVELAHLKAEPTCVACGSVKVLQVHHRQPFALHPELELDPNNLITLCMGPNECHLKIGHGGAFAYYNPSIDLSVATSRNGSILQAVAYARGARLRL